MLHQTVADSGFRQRGERYERAVRSNQLRLSTRSSWQLGATQRAASEAAGGGDAGFKETGRAYVRFALANPALFRLIFTTPALALASEAGDIPSEASNLLQANAARQAAKEGGEASVRAIRAWALVHGLAMLMLDGQIPADDGLVLNVIC